MDILNRMMDPLEDRRFCVLRLLTAVLIGALAGALCAKTVVKTAPEWLQTGSQLQNGAASLRGLFLSLLFPAATFAAYVFGRKRLIYALFFCKGLLVCFVLCCCAGAGCLSGELVGTTALRAVLPLPVSFFSAATLLSDPRGLKSPVGRLLIPLHVSASLLVMLADALID